MKAQPLKVQKKSLADEVADRLRSQIASGEYAVGEKLPAEPKLMELFGVGRSSVREAIKLLSNSGILSVRQGLGTFVASRYAKDEPMADRLSRADEADLDEVRRLLEMKISEKAALKRSDSDMANINESLEKIRQANKSCDLKKCVDADIEFHTAIAVASHNEIFFELYKAASSHLRKCYLKKYKDYKIFATAETLHESLVKSIAEKDAKKSWDIAEKIIKHG